MSVSWYNSEPSLLKAQLHIQSAVTPAHATHRDYCYMLPTAIFDIVCQSLILGNTLYKHPSYRLPSTVPASDIIIRHFMSQL